MLGYIYRELFRIRSAGIGGERLIHEVENGSHRIVYADGKQGEWVSRDEIARLDHYAAVTEQHDHCLPLVFEVKEVTDYERHYYNHDSDDYWMRSKDD